MSFRFSGLLLFEPAPFEPAAGAAGYHHPPWHMPRPMMMTRCSRSGL